MVKAAMFEGFRMTLNGMTGYLAILASLKMKKTDMREPNMIKQMMRGESQGKVVPPISCRTLAVSDDHRLCMGQCLGLNKEESKSTIFSNESRPHNTMNPEKNTNFQVAGPTNPRNNINVNPRIVRLPHQSIAFKPTRAGVRGLWTSK